MSYITNLAHLVINITTEFVPQDSAVKKKLPLSGIPTYTSMTNDNKLFSLIYSKKHICGYLSESPRQGESDKYQQHVSRSI